MRTAFIATPVLAATSGAALAGESGEKAKAHFAAIAAGDVAKIMAACSDMATRTQPFPVDVTPRAVA